MLADDTTFVTMTLGELLETGTLKKSTVGALRRRYLLG
jgi:hypothetical protein